MRIVLLGLMILTVAYSTAHAGVLPPADSQTPWSVAQYQGNSHARTDDRPARPQRYVCVVPPRESDDRNRPYVCRADAGRVGGRCRCPNVVGNGRLDLDY
ncbi:hypothetical protein [Neorhizobium alkalisoli]|uniref:hypothetical protein n=1 Tax=Neorhizobium alkalisoli TaxID=528178 RepID=UPI000CF858F5|nr:hypothetical protein [Neorhizobium alkalisoli]